MGNLYDESVPVEKLVEQGASEVPLAYLQPSVINLEGSGEVGDGIPTIDLSPGRNKSKLLWEIEEACKSWGIFRVINHGIPQEIIGEMMRSAHDFFNLQMEEKMEYYAPQVRPLLTTYGLRFNGSTVVDWRDFLSIGTCRPLTDEVESGWPSKPSSFRRTAREYFSATYELGVQLFEMVFESLGLPPSRLGEVFSGDLRQVTLFNRYLPCPQPERVLALRKHTDPGTLTLLTQNDVPGLQVFKDGKWVLIPPVPGSFLVNVGDHVQIMSNGRFKSPEHRAVANTGSTRYSVATFFNPPADALVGPLPELIADGDQARYPTMNFDEYIRKYIEHGADYQSEKDLV